MRLCVQTNGIDLTDSLKKKAAAAIDVALENLENEVVCVFVYLADTNGPSEGGVDKACRLVVVTRSLDPLVAESMDEDLEVVIDRATDRLGVLACQQSRTQVRNRHRYSRYVDSDDVLGFTW